MKWLVAYLSPTAPKSVYSQLVLGGHGAFVPTCKEETVFRGKPALVERPLIKGYVFLRYTHRWTDANKIEGVKVLTRIGENGKQEPHVLPVDFVDYLQTETAPVEDGTPLRYGDWVRITVGAATGCFGRVKETKKGKVTVTVDFMGGERVFYIPRHALELARPSNGSENIGDRGRLTAAKIA